MEAFARLNGEYKLTAHLPDDVVDIIRRSFYDAQKQSTMRCHYCSATVLTVTKSWWMGCKMRVDYRVDQDGYIWNLNTGAFRSPCRPATRDDVSAVRLAGTQGTVRTHTLPIFMECNGMLYENEAGCYSMDTPYFMLGSKCVCCECRFQWKRVRLHFSEWAAYRWTDY